ncbi:hypothetical protein [Anabaena sp. UHCC 0399]|nr:hypothetical protein [Anabaena sp. UHCC 0399]MEA5569287.1 hypothetical protein [Anabaena sp. UHCC 0399]
MALLPNLGDDLVQNLVPRSLSLKDRQKVALAVILLLALHNSGMN